MSPLWMALLIAAVGSYLLKLAGVSLPESILNHPKVQRVAELLPIAMLSALVAVELFDGGGRYRVDWRTLAGVAAGVIAFVATTRFPRRLRGRDFRHCPTAPDYLSVGDGGSGGAPPRRGPAKSPAAPGRWRRTAR